MPQFFLKMETPELTSLSSPSSVAAIANNTSAYVDSSINTACDSNKSSNMFRVFVYGTLKPGYHNYRVAAPWVVGTAEARAFGKLYDLPQGYPALTAGKDIIHGYLLSFVDKQALADLDDLEDYDSNKTDGDNLYYREETEVFDGSMNSIGKAWIYRMTDDSHYVKRGTYDPSGNWKPLVV
jgi:gamma-glutamylcyclotransferase (GGCT)/AIG2-like uncharacterized protein YtfP